MSCGLTHSTEAENDFASRLFRSHPPTAVAQMHRQAVIVRSGDVPVSGIIAMQRGHSLPGY
jgi:hypothetical protein